MDVFQLKVKVFLLEDIQLKDLQTKITTFIDQAFLSDKTMAKLHQENRFKLYSYDRLYPLEASRIYNNGKIYTFTIRTINYDLHQYFCGHLPQTYTNEMKGLVGTSDIIPMHLIDTIYTLTPAIQKNEFGYWRTGGQSLDDYGNRLKINLIKKYNSFYKAGEQLDEDFSLYNRIDFLNKQPIPVNYKNISLLGDKIRLHITDHPTAQLLAHMSIGTGICEMNSRGNGFVNYQWIKVGG